MRNILEMVFSCPQGQNTDVGHGLKDFFLDFYIANSEIIQNPKTFEHEN